MPVRVLSLDVDPIGPREAVDLALGWAAEPRGRVICAANVHMVMEAWDDEAFAALMRGADLVVADGRPVWFACRLLSSEPAQHLRGQELMSALCSSAGQRGVPIGLFGSTEETLKDLQAALRAAYPGLEIALAVSPPFRPLSEAERAQLFADLRAAGVRLLFVALGCPKQERWMLENRARSDCVMVGVGAAFDMLSGRVQPAPVWAQRAGLEWLHRLAAEPQRLWRRYAKHNARFVLLLARQVVSRRLLQRNQ